MNNNASRMPRSYLSATLLAAALLCAPHARSQQTNPQLRAAIEDYRSGRFAAAEHSLTNLLSHSPNDFPINELLGLTLAAEGHTGRALEYLQRATLLAPHSGTAHANLAAAYLHLGQSKAAERELHEALRLEPQSYTPNHNLGEFYAQRQRFVDAARYLQQAQAADSHHLDNQYDLALALFKAGQNDAARRQIQTMLAQHPNADLYSLLGSVEEAGSRYLQAARAFHTAANLDSSADNIFSWGDELLRHQTYDPAIAIFQDGVRRYPGSAQLTLGLGIAQYGRGLYPEAIRSFTRAVDLRPHDLRPYLLLALAFSDSNVQSPEIGRCLQLFVKNLPDNADAYYYDALYLIRQQLLSGNPDFAPARHLLERAIALRPAFADAHLQLGVVDSRENRLHDAVVEYRRALAGNPQLSKAHLHLGQALARLGQRSAAAAEFAAFERLRQSSAGVGDSRRETVKAFLYTIRGNLEMPRAERASAAGNRSRDRSDQRERVQLRAVAPHTMKQPTRQ